MLAVVSSAFAQKNGNDNIFSIGHKWTKIAGFSYQYGYPYGFSLAGGSFMSFGFGEEGKQFAVSATEQREPTWSMRFGWLGYTFDEDVTGMGAISFRPMLVMGFERAKITNLTTGSTEKNTYFTMAPTLVVNVYMLHFSVGYEIVPKFSQINGLNFGIGFSIPSSADKISDKLPKNKNKK